MWDPSLFSKMHIVLILFVNIFRQNCQRRKSQLTSTDTWVLIVNWSLSTFFYLLILMITVITHCPLLQLSKYVIACLIFSFNNSFSCHLPIWMKRRLFRAYSNLYFWKWRLRLGYFWQLYLHGLTCVWIAIFPLNSRRFWSIACRFMQTFATKKEWCRCPNVFVWLEVVVIKYDQFLTVPFANGVPYRTVRVISDFLYVKY